MHTCFLEKVPYCCLQITCYILIIDIMSILYLQCLEIKTQNPISHGCFLFSCRTLRYVYTVDHTLDGPASTSQSPAVLVASGWTGGASWDFPCCCHSAIWGLQFWLWPSTWYSGTPFWCLPVLHLHFLVSLFVSLSSLTSFVRAGEDRRPYFAVWSCWSCGNLVAAVTRKFNGRQIHWAE